MNEKKKEQIEAVAKGFANLETPQKNFIAGFIAGSIMKGSEKENGADLMKQLQKLQPNV